jgi:hypothetical protein
VFPYSYASTTALEERFPRELTDTEVARAEILLQDASYILSNKIPGLNDAIVAEEEAVSYGAMLVVVAMVTRALLYPLPANPNVQSQSTVVGPFQEQITYRSDDGSLYLYARELGDLTDLLRSNRAGAVSMRSRGL